MSNEIQIFKNKPTVRQDKAKKFVDLVEGGTPPEEAAEEVGTTLVSLRRDGTLGTVVSELLERITKENLFNKEVRKKIAQARVMEIMLQDERPSLALKAAQGELEVAKPGVAIQFNQQNNLITDPAVLQALKSLQIEMKKDEDDIDNR